MVESIFSNTWSLVLIIVFFGGSIFVHELGHFLAAKRRGLKIERFSIGFGPRIFTWKKDGIEYCISALPLGGYVALPQLAEMRGIEGEYDASKENLPPIGYADKMIVSVMGAVFNVIFAIGLACILWFTGVPVPKASQETIVGHVFQTIENDEGIMVASPARKAGLLPGDEIVEVDGNTVKGWQAFTESLAVGSGRNENGDPRAQLTILRDGERMTLTIDPILSGPEEMRTIGIGFGYPLIVGGVSPGSPAEKAGLQEGDVITKVDGQRIYSLTTIHEYIKEDPTREMTVVWERNGEEMSAPIQAKEVAVTRGGETAYLMGFSLSADETVLVKESPVAQISNHIDRTLAVLGALINPKSDIGFDKLAGPPGIAYAIHKLSAIDIRHVLALVVLININLAILNLLPIPVLDGGHMAIATISKLKGSPLSPGIVLGTQQVFMILLFGLMIYVMFFDVRRVGRDISDEREYERQMQQRIIPDFTAPLPTLTPKGEVQ